MIIRTFTFSLCLLSLLTLLAITYQKNDSGITGDLVIIDESLQDYRSLAADLPPGAQVIYVPNSPEGFQNLTKQLATHGKVSRVHLMTHGAEGNFVLGQTQLNSANIGEYGGFWQSLGNVLERGKSSLLIYSCQLTAGSDGKNFVQNLHRMLGVSVAASDDQTGSGRRGGDWDLEYAAGKIIKKQVLKFLDFKGLLVPTFTQLTGASSPFTPMTIMSDNQLIYGDFDADGDIDIHSYDGSSVTNDFWQNNGSGSFSKVTGAASPFENVFENAVFYSADRAFVADWDNDGDADIYVPMRNSAQNEKNFFYRNDNGKYVLLSGASSPFNNVVVSGYNQLIFGDFDNDGDIDLHNYPGSQLDNEFWRNNGSGVFSKVTGAQNPFDNLPGKAAFSNAQYTYVADWDNDGDVDILMTRRGNTSVREYYRNNGGVYSLQTGASNPFNGMPIATDNQLIFGDFDADGDIDLHTSDGSSTLVFWRNNGSGIFTQVTGAGNPFNTLPNSGAFYNNALMAFVADWDNDHDVDVFTTNYTATGQKYFFRQNDAPPRITATSPANLAAGVSVSGNISLTFSRAVTGAGGKNIQIRRSDNNSVFATIAANSAQVTGSGTTTITVDPATDFAGTTGYYVTIDKAAFVDSEGRIFEGISNNTTWRFTTGAAPVAPTVTTGAVSDIALTTALLSGTVTADGGVAVTERGFVWSTSAAPTTSSNKVVVGSGTGAFNTTATGLPQGTQIYVRAYAINAKGTSYGSEADFYTQTSISSITPLDASPGSASSVTYQVIFAQSVVSVDATDFTLTTSGVSGASVSGISGSGTTYTVTVNTGSGNGTIKLNFTGLTGTVPNVNAEFTTAGAYTIYKVSNAGDYYRSAGPNGLWTTPGSWESSPDNSFWITATSSPGNGAAGTLIAGGHTMRIPGATDLNINNLTIDGVLYSGDAQLNLQGNFTNNGTVRGNGTFSGLGMTNAGSLSPGESPGALGFTSGLANQGTLVMEIGGTVAGTGYDQVKTGTFTAGGSLSVSLINGFTPALGDAFILVDASAITGTFSTLDLPDITPRVWETSYENGNFTITAVNDPMPVTLVSFTASRKESAVELTWSTSSEINSSHFEIQRSPDGKFWKNIGTIAARNYSPEILRYRFADTLPAHAVNFYRLRMVDTDGTFAFSRIERVRFAESRQQIRVYPNPATERIFLDAANAEDIQSVEVYSVSGILHSVGRYTQAGIDVKALPPGIFLLKTTSANREVRTFRFAKH
ncbi:hypothetical protein GCM10023091_21580 [Ravibacter arvi]|uniref:Secreted protein (Por secretion system target) n=1 Tax=Ravibacter arvi TaxID=2051041 RepID=A0ABP8LXA7_9BACT